MSILEARIIDFVATRPGNGVVRLVIADHLGWENLEEHSRLLRDKINSYLAFVESGQVFTIEKPRLPPAPVFEIALMCKHPPTFEAVELLRSIRAFLEKAKIRFTWEDEPSGAEHEG